MRVLKLAMKLLGLLRALPHYAAYRLVAAPLGRPRALMDASERIARVPGLWGIYTRQAFYTLALKRVGRDVHFGFMSLFSKPGAELEDEVYIGRMCTIGWAHIEAGARLADGVQVLSGRRQHDTAHDEPAFVRVRIGARAWIGAGAVVMADVGEGAVIAAGAVVVQPVPPHARVAGVPARRIDHQRLAAEA